MEMTEKNKDAYRIKLHIMQLPTLTSSEAPSSIPSYPPFSSPLCLQKYRVDMPGSNSAFIPTINAITTSQDLQWMVQPTVITSMSNPYTRSHPYGHHLTNGPGLLAHNTLARPGVIRSIGDARGRRKRDEQVSEAPRQFISGPLLHIHPPTPRQTACFIRFPLLLTADPRRRGEKKGEAREEQAGCGQMPQPPPRAHRDAARGEFEKKPQT